MDLGVWLGELSTDSLLSFLPSFFLSSDPSLFIHPAEFGYVAGLITTGRRRVIV